MFHPNKQYEAQYAEGYNAAHSGRHKNPYSPQTEEYRAFEAGFADYQLEEWFG